MEFTFGIITNGNNDIFLSKIIIPAKNKFRNNIFMIIEVDKENKWLFKTQLFNLKYLNYQQIIMDHYGFGYGKFG